TTHLATYDREARDRLVRHLRAVLPREIQTDWNLFAYLITTGEPGPRRITPGRDEILLFRDRWDPWLLAGTLGAALLGLIGCGVAGEDRFFIVLLVPVA